MSDMMTFPATVEEFMEQYKIVDDEKVYTNGADLVPIFRMMQWFEHVSATDTISRKEAIDALDEQIALCDKALKSFGISMKDEYTVKVEKASLVAFRERLEYLPPVQPEPCEDAVSRKAVIDGLNDAVHEHNITDFDAVATILALPPVTPKQRTGKWIDGIIPNDSGGLPVIVCDQCNTFFPLQFGDGHNFCPNCGAKMEGDAE